MVKYAGGVSRCFAAIGGLMLTGVLEWAAFGGRLSPRIWVSLPVVAFAMHLYARAAESACKPTAKGKEE